MSEDMEKDTVAKDGDIEEKNENTAEKKQNSILDDVLEIAESTIATVFVIVMILTYFLHPVNVVGSSMNDTLSDNDRIFMSTVYASIDYGDIVIINNDAAYLLDENNNVYKKEIPNSRLNECIIKRVIGEPGQTVEIRTDTNEIVVDGKVLVEPYIKEPTLNSGIYSGPFTIPDGYYFVMGDNRNASSDSRDGDVGFIKKDQIYGKALLRYSPFSEFKSLLF